MTIPHSVIDRAKRQFDLTDRQAQEELLALTETLLGYPLDAVAEAAQQPDAPLELRLAYKLVDSRQAMLQIERPLHIGVVFAMWGEHNRLRPKSPDNPNGEDALRVKMTQLAWITADTPVSWSLLAVDDGDPNDSGALAAEIAADHPLGEHVHVLHLDRAVPTDSGPLRELASANDSRKGGAIIYGCLQALEELGVDAVVYTDADNSVHLGQLGLLLRPLVEDGVRIVLGNRKHPQSVLVKQEGRWGIGIKALRHMQRMVGEAIFSREIRDTQAAFKLYEGEVLRQIIASPAVFDFSFDTDWILAAIAMQERFAQVPCAFIDSAAESASIAQGPMTTWETLLKGLVKGVRARGVPFNTEMARVLDEEIHSAADLDLLINHLPPQLENASDRQLGDPALMSPAEMQAWIQQRKREG